MPKHRPVVKFERATPKGWDAKVRVGPEEYSAWGNSKDQAEKEVLREARRDGSIKDREDYKSSR